MVGRYYGQAPEVDGCVYLSGAEVKPGELRRVRVASATAYDLLGEVLDDTPPPPLVPLRRRRAPPGVGDGAPPAGRLTPR
jgi:ribosomal protein S12 methylthiotransferase